MMRPQHFANQKQSASRILCIWLPNWPLQRIYTERPQLRQREVVLYERYHGTCLRVVACSGNYGIYPGMSLTEARSLAKVHDELHDPLADRTSLLELAAWCEQFSPIVGIEGSDHLCLDITGLESIFGSEELLFRQVLRAFRQRRLLARVGIANTIGAAWAASHHLNGIIPPDESPIAVSKLPIMGLRLPLDCIDILTELGIKTISQLLSLPRSDLKERFDSQLLLRLDQLFGTIAEPIISHRPLPDVTAEIQLEYGVTNRQSMDIVLQQLTERICQTLQERQQGVIRFEFDLRTEKGVSLKILVGLFRASARPLHLLELTRLQFEQLTLPGPIFYVKVSVLIAAPLQVQQQVLFEDVQSANQRHIALLIDRLSGRLGRNNVMRAVLQADAQPEVAFRYEPLAGLISRKSKQSLKKYPLRPLRLERKPISIRIVSRQSNHCPLQMEWKGIHKIARAWGPERIQTAWWRGRYVQRDYYRVETESNQRFWIFRRLQDSLWFLHGVFD